MSPRKGVVARIGSMVALASVLAACTSEHEITLQELAAWDDEDTFRVDGDPFSGVLVVRDGDVVRGRIELDEGHPDGTLEQFHVDGAKASRAEVRWDEKSGKLIHDGETQRWNKEGVRTLRAEYADDELVLRETWCDNEKDESREEFEGGKPSSKSQWDCETGKKVVEQHFDGDGKLQGEQRRWAPDGTPVAKLNYQAGELDGAQEAWYANGKPRSRAVFAKGVPVGKHESWDAKGRVAEVGEYGANGAKRGLWLEVPASDWGDGTWKSYSEVGTPPKRQHYGPDGFIDPQWVGPYVDALGDGSMGNPETVAFYLKEGKVAVSDALPASYDGGASSSRFEFPQSQWTYAVVVANAAVLPTLLANGADINQADSKGTTRLMRCAAYFNRDVRYGGRGCAPEDLGDMLGKGAKAAALDADGRNALHFLVDDTQRRDRTLWGRPHAESVKARTDAIAALAKAGAAVDARDREGWTPLVRALAERRADLALALLEQGASAKGPGPNGTQPIHWVFLESPDRYEISDDEFTRTMLRELAARGADVNAPMDWDGGKVTLRDLALRHGLIGVAGQLDSFGAR